MTWEIVLGLIALVGFGITVATPIIKLNTSITKLNCSIDTLNDGMATNDRRLTQHGQQLDKLEHRVTILETFHDGRERDKK
jgi:TolA-binding protein